MFRSRQHASQLKSFNGLSWGAIRPTDIDAFIDFQDKVFVFLERKFRYTEMPYGQKLAFQRVVDACHNPPYRHSFGLLLSHDTESGDVDISQARVVSYRYAGQWLYPASEIQTRKAIDKCLEYVQRPTLKLVK